MTPTTPYALTFFREREQSAYDVYRDSIKAFANDDVIPLTKWHTARDLRNDWQLTFADWKRATAATPCTHTAAERAHEAQRCDWCWTISEYIRLTTPKESE